MRQYFLTIPQDHEEAAKLDGAGYFKTFWRVMLPLAGPALAARHDPHLPGDVERLLLARSSSSRTRRTTRSASGIPQFVQRTRRYGRS